MYKILRKKLKVLFQIHIAHNYDSLRTYYLQRFIKKLSMEQIKEEIGAKIFLLNPRKGTIERWMIKTSPSGIVGLYVWDERKSVLTSEQEREATQIVKEILTRDLGEKISQKIMKSNSFQQLFVPHGHLMMP